MAWGRQWDAGLWCRRQGDILRPRFLFGQVALPGGAYGPEAIYIGLRAAWGGGGGGGGAAGDIHCPHRGGCGREVPGPSVAPRRWPAPWLEGDVPGGGGGGYC